MSYTYSENIYSDSGTTGGFHFTGSSYKIQSETDILIVRNDSEDLLKIEDNLSTFNTNVKILGDFYISGSTTTIYTENMNIKDNIILLNSGETSGGVSQQYAGIEIDRHPSDNYKFVFDENSEIFRIGQSGATTTLQAVATRDDLMISNGVSYWDNVNFKLISDSNFTYSSDTLLVPNLNISNLAGNYNLLIDTNGDIITGSTGLTGSVEPDMSIQFASGTTQTGSTDFIYDYNNEIVYTPQIITLSDKVISEGKKWTQHQYSTTAEQLMDITYGNGKFVAVSINDSSHSIMYSDDGINWTKTESGNDDAQWHSVCYGNNIFVAVAHDASTGSRITHSFDGINWLTDNTNFNDGYHYSIVRYYKNIFIAIDRAVSNGQNGSNNVAYSYNGIDWFYTTISSSNGKKQDFREITYGNNKFIVISDTTNTTTSGGYTFTSTDGINWTEQTPSNNQGYHSISYADGKFVAVSRFRNSTNTDSQIDVSYDGVSWLSADTSITNSEATMNNITYGNGLFVVMMKSKSYCLISSDGFNWMKSDLPSSSYYYKTYYHDGMFVTISRWGTNVITSGKHNTSNYEHDTKTFTNGKYKSSIINFTNIENGGGVYQENSFNFGYNNKIYSEKSAILGGGNNIINVNYSGSTILGGQNISAIRDNLTHVPDLYIKNLVGTTASLIINSNGIITTGSTNVLGGSIQNQEVAFGNSNNEITGSTDFIYDYNNEIVYVPTLSINTTTTSTDTSLTYLVRNESSGNVEKIVEEDWHYVGETGEPSFEQDWGNYSTGTWSQNLRFKKTLDNVVWIEGYVKTLTSTDTILFYLPSGYFNVSTNYLFFKKGGSITDMCGIIIDGSAGTTDGRVRLTDSRTTAQYFNVSFKLDD